MPWNPLALPDDETTRTFNRTFRRRSRFLLDHNVDVELRNALSRLGWNVRTAKEQGLALRDDTDVFAAAFRDDRVLITHDRDFLNERRFPPHRNPGVLVIPGGDGATLDCVRAMAAALPLVGEYREVFRGACVTVTSDGVISIRNCEHDSGARKTRRYRYGGKLPQEWVDR